MLQINCMTTHYKEPKEIHVLRYEHESQTLYTDVVCDNDESGTMETMSALKFIEYISIEKLIPISQEEYDTLYRPVIYGLYFINNSLKVYNLICYSAVTKELNSILVNGFDKTVDVDCKRMPDNMTNCMFEMFNSIQISKIEYSKKTSEIDKLVSIEHYDNI